MADWFVGPIMDKIINACSDYLQDQYRCQTGMKGELERLRENHSKIQAVVSAYTRAQIRDRNPALNRWIWQLRDAIDEADDVLDDFEYMKLEEEHQEQDMEETKVRSSFSRLFLEPARKLRRVCDQALKKDPNLERLEAVVKKLDKVSAEVSTFLHLLDNAKQGQQQLELQLFKDRETGCLPKSDLIGRGEEKDFVLQWLRKPTIEDPTHIAGPTLYKNISLLSIVGHGGMGKTTLLQHIYEDLKDEFELKMWVCVSNDFDAKKVIADMLDILTKERPHLESPLAAVQERLKDAVQSKRFLLVLDDIWEEDMSKWENVLSPLTSGSSGSKILLTTRMDAAASAIAKVIKQKMESLRIKGLEEDVCLQLLNTHAFAGVENLGAHKKLTHIASLIVKKLSGSPLAAKVIGGVLNSDLDESFWMNVLNRTDVLHVESEPGRNNVLSILQLSYTFLQQPLRTCFAFCGIFPQDHVFDKYDLVRMWIALGFIHESEGETLEDIGGRYFNVLVRKSFFDEFGDKERTYYKMHDLLNDLAHTISSEECFRFVGDNVLSLKIPKNVRHLFVDIGNSEALRMIKDVKNLRSLFFKGGRDVQDYTEVFTEIFMASRSIRLLFIYSPSLKKMSEAIKNLRHLRYLNIIADLTQMPTSLSSLYHLRFLICSNDFLPDDVSNLSNLRHLGFPKNKNVRVRGIGKLRSLQELNEFNVKNWNGYGIGELEHLSELRKIKINFLKDVMDAREACTAKLCEKRRLTDLFLNWSDTNGRVNSDIDVNVLDNLEPYKNLKRFSIVSYKGARSAKWMYEADLISNLEYISLNGCSEWETLPPFGQLPHLKRLYLRNMPKAKRVDFKFHGNDKVSVFPSLEVLEMGGLLVLEDWFDGAGAATDDCFFPCLTKLFLYNCPNLQELPYLPPKLKEMCIHSTGWKALNCKQGNSKSIPLERVVVRSCLKITSVLLADVAELIIQGCPNLISLGGQQQVESGAEKSLQSLSSSLERLSSTKCLSLGDLESLECLPSSFSAISSFTHITLDNIPLLKSLPELPPSLSRLYINKLDNLQCLPSSFSAISSFTEIALDNIPLLKSLPELPSSLESLNLGSLNNLEYLPSFSATSSLRTLKFDGIPLLKSLPELPSSLKSLALYSLDNLEYLPSFSAISSLRNIEFYCIPLLKSLPELPSSLESLTLYSLDNLECLPSSLSAISSLKHLELRRIPLLKSLPDLPSSMFLLDIEDCHPELMERYKKSSGPDWHKIAHIPRVRYRL